MVKIFEFESRDPPHRRAFTLDSAGQALPGRRRHWRPSRAHEIAPGMLIGTEIGHALDSAGHYISPPDEVPRELLELLYR